MAIDYEGVILHPIVLFRSHKNAQVSEVLIILCLIREPVKPGFSLGKDGWKGADQASSDLRKNSKYLIKQPINYIKSDPGGGLLFRVA